MLHQFHAAPIKRHLKYAYLLTVLTLALLTGIAFNETWHLHRSMQRLNHLSEELAQGRRFYRLIVDLETGQRGYLITGDRRFLAPRQEALRLLPDELKRFQQMLDHDEEIAQAREMYRLIETWIAESNREIALRQQNSPDLPRYVAQGEGRVLMERIRVSIEALTTRHQHLRDELSSQINERITFSRAIRLIVLVCMFILLTLIFLYVYRLLTRSYGGVIQMIEDDKAELQKANELLNIQSAELQAKNRQLQEQSQELEALNEQLHLQSAALAASNEELKVLDQMKDRFLQTVTHELRSPLTAILGFTGMFKEGLLGPLTPEQRESIDLVHQRANDQLRLINDLLDLAKLESGIFTATRGSANLAAELQDCLDSFRSLYQPKALHVTVDLPEPLPRLAIDPLRLRQILFNLISNAVKFTPTGGFVRISAAVETGQVTTTIANSGAGIAPDALQRVFERFYQAQPSDTGQVGTGLGLSITRHLVEQYGGAIWVESAPERETRFSFRLPTGESGPVSDPAPVGETAL